MKFIVDENISHRTLKFLKELNYDVEGVPEHLKGSDDETIISLAIVVLRVRLPTVERVNQVLEKFLRTVNLEELGKCVTSSPRFRMGLPTVPSLTIRPHPLWFGARFAGSRWEVPASTTRLDPLAGYGGLDLHRLGFGVAPPYFYPPALSALRDDNKYVKGVYKLFGSSLRPIHLPPFGGRLLGL